MPQTDEGRRIWSMFPAIFGQIRSGMGGAYALDLGACLAIAAGDGMEAGIATPLLRGIEVGMIETIRERAQT